MPRQKVRRPWVDYLVYLVVRSLVAFAQVLSIEQSYALARFLGWVLYHADKRHRDVGLDNLKHAYGDSMSEKERDQVVRGVYRHFCMMLIEILHLPRKIHLANWRDYFVLEGHGHLLDLFMSGKRPLIFLTGHYGNWEMAGYVFGLFGFPTVAVARTLDNPYLERYLKSFRERTGQQLIPKTGGFDQMVEVLKNNRASLVSGRSRRRPAGTLRRLFRSSSLDAQGDRAPGNRVSGAGHRGRRAPDRPRVPL